MENENGNMSDGGSVKKGGKKMFWAVIIIIILLAVGFAFAKGKVSNPFAAVPSVATVNGVSIPKATYETQLASSIASYKAQGNDVTTNPTQLAQVKEQVLDNLINTELLNQGAKAQGITASSTQVASQYQTFLTQEGGADKLAADLKKNNMTDAQLKTNIAQQLTIQAYLLKNIDVSSITASDAEVAQFYAQYSASQKAASSTIAVPALTTLSDQIKQQIISNKENTAVNSLIASLRASAKIATSTNI